MHRLEGMVKVDKNEWKKNVSLKCRHKFQFHHNEGDGSGTLLYTINKKGERIPRLSNPYCELLWPYHARCRFSKCPRMKMTESEYTDFIKKS